MNKILLTVTFILTSIVLFGQDVEIKKDVVYIDAKECLKIKSDKGNYSVLDLNGNEIMYLKYYCAPGMLMEIIFPEQKKTYVSRTTKSSKLAYLKRFVSEKVLENCKINADALDKFLFKFDEKDK